MVTAVAEALGRDALKGIARDGLVLPRAPYPGQKWKPRTPDEGHLLGEGRRLNTQRERLLAQIGFMQDEAEKMRARVAALQDENAQLRADARQLRQAARASLEERADPAVLTRLTGADLQILDAAARGETLALTAARLGLTAATVKGRRNTVRRRLDVPTFARALVVATAASVVTPAGGAL